MSDYKLFEMLPERKRHICMLHIFYVEQAQKRLLSQFDDMESEADQAARDWLNANQHRFNPDVHDASDFEQRAYEEACTLYQLLEEMRDNVRLGVVSGMYHEWEKALKEWLADELARLYYYDKAVVWKADFCQIIELLECLNWPVRDRSFHPDLNACRLVVNVYKHGYGRSFEELKEQCPEFLTGPSGRFVPERMRYARHSDLRVNAEQVQKFSLAIISFWDDCPEEIWESAISKIPDWLFKALDKGAKEREKIRKV